jgi:phospholipid transport system substrate-binding protein
MATTAKKESAELFVSTIGDTAIGIVASKLTVEQKEAKLTKLFEDSVDTKWIAKFVLGSYGRQITPEQSNEYSELYHKFLLQSYVPKFKSYTNQKIVVLSTSKEDANNFLVQTEIKAEGEPTVNVDYKVRKGADGKFKIIDIVAEDVSMITTQRSEFGSILSRNGVDGLIERLKAKVAQPQ